MLNEAIRLYTGFGIASWPQKSAERVLKELPSSDGASALRKVELLLDQLAALRPDWQTQSLSSGSRWAGEQMTLRLQP